MLKTICTIVYAVVCVALIIIVLMQQGKDRGLGVISGQTYNGSGSYWDKVKKHSKEGILARLTVILSVLFFASSLFLAMGIIK